MRKSKAPVTHDGWNYTFLDTGVSLSLRIIMRIINWSVGTAGTHVAYNNPISALALAYSVAYNSPISALALACGVA